MRGFNFPELGTDIRLTDEGNFVLGAGGDLVLCGDEVCLLQGVRHRLITPLGGLFYDLTYGLDYYNYLHRDNVPLSRAELAEAIKAQLYLEPRILRRSVVVEVLDWTEKILTMGLTFTWVEGGQTVSQVLWINTNAGVEMSGTVWMPDYLSAQNFINGEEPAGVVDGVNKDFTLANVPVANTVQVFLDGQLMDAPDDYTLTGRTITFTTAPAPVAGYTPQVTACYFKK